MINIIYHHYDKYYLLSFHGNNDNFVKGNVIIFIEFVTNRGEGGQKLFYTRQI